jgi:pSer/pThr/pTyr-binding forkhead associated (FHA) protein
MKVYLRSLDDQTHFQIEEGENLLLGRLDGCDIVLEDGSVSSRHARLSLSDGALVVADLDSTNGTRVNYSLLVEPMALMDGDTVEFGNVTFTVDGPGLRSEREPVTESAFVNEFKEIDLSGPIDATMQLSGFSDEDLVETDESAPAVQTDLEAVVDSEEPAAVEPGEAQADIGEDPESDEEGSPLGRIVVTVILLLVFSGVMGLYLWQYVPAP